MFRCSHKEKSYFKKNIFRDIDYHDDPSNTVFYPVENFKTNADVRKYLEQYLSNELISSLFHDDFLEYEGTLYMLRGDRGYGGSTYDKESLKYLGEENAI